MQRCNGADEFLCNAHLDSCFKCMSQSAARPAVQKTSGCSVPCLF
jgi:hypothetical protein